MRHMNASVDDVNVNVAASTALVNVIGRRQRSLADSVQVPLGKELRGGRVTDNIPLHPIHILMFSDGF